MPQSTDTPALPLLMIIFCVTLNRPEASNAFNTQMAWDLISLFEELAVAPDDLRVVVITGAGDRAFCAGGDLKERNGMTDSEWFAQHLVYERMVRGVVGCPLPLIGAINGAAYGGGCELAAALDFIYTVKPRVLPRQKQNLALFPVQVALVNLARSVGEKTGWELILSGKVFSAEDALKWGLANAICKPDELMEATPMARRLRQRAHRRPGKAGHP